MLDSLINGKDGHIAGTRETTGVEQPLQVSEDARGTIRYGDDPIDKIGTRQVKVVSGNRAALMRQQRRIAAQQTLDPAQSFSGCKSTYCGHDAPPTGDPTTGNSKSSMTAFATAFSTIPSIGRARSAASTFAIRARVSGFRGVNSVQQS